MKLINKKSKKGVVNIFSDFVLNKIEKQHRSIIQVTDFGHFFIINGITESTEVLDCSKIRDEFVSEYQDVLNSLDIKQINVMDLIKYDVKKWKFGEQIFWNFYNSSKPKFNEKLIDFEFKNNHIFSVFYDESFIFENDLYFENNTIKTIQPSIQITSEFPYGYSLKNGRGLLYYFEYIIYNVKNSSLFNCVRIEFKNERNSENELNLKIYTDNEYNNELTSLVLDIFNFELDNFYKKFDDYNFCLDISQPFNKKLWLVQDINQKDLIII